MRFYLAIIFLISLLPWATAENIVLKNGRTLVDVHILEQGIDYVRVRHNDGITRLEAEDLSDTWKTRLHLTPSEIQNKRQEQDRALTEQRRERQERDEALRATLSEAEKNPRYLSGADIVRMIGSYVHIESVEAEAAALQWNANEAQRVGLSDQAEDFMNRLKSYSVELERLRRERETSNQYWKNLEERYQHLTTESERRLDSLSNQVEGLRRELDSKSNSSRTVIYTTPTPTTYYSPWYYERRKPVVVVRQPPVPPRRPRPQRIIKQTPFLRNSSRPNSSYVRPAKTRPAQPAKLQPARPAKIRR